MSPSVEQKPFKVKEVADMLGVTEQVVNYAIRNRKIFAFRLGKAWLIPRTEIERIVQGEIAA